MSPKIATRAVPQAELGTMVLVPVTARLCVLPPEARRARMNSSRAASSRLREDYVADVWEWVVANRY